MFESREKVKAGARADTHVRAGNLMSAKTCCTTWGEALGGVGERTLRVACLC